MKDSLSSLMWIIILNTIIVRELILSGLQFVISKRLSRGVPSRYDPTKQFGKTVAALERKE